jgi:hypothetical protein
MVRPRRHLAGKVHVVVADGSAVDRLAQVGAVHEHVEIGAGGAGVAIVDDPPESAPREIDAESSHRRVDVGRLGPEERDVVVAGEHLADTAVDLLATAERRPVQVVHPDSRRRGSDSDEVTSAAT